MQLWELYKIGKETLPDIDARLLAEKAVGYSYFGNERKEITDREVSFFSALLERRKKGEPLQYILGNWEFMSLPFEVEEGVLIPRNDTEILCEEAIKAAKEMKNPSILDMCCGSGCIGISVLKYSGGSLTMCDVSDKALSLSEKNAEKNGVSAKMIKKDILKEDLCENYDLILSNPPYIKTGDIKDLSVTVKDFEPHLALDGGEDGLLFYRRISENFCKNLNPGGKIFLECGQGQAQEVAEMLSFAGLSHVRIIKDLCGIDRVVSARK